jgi:predicted RNase H-like HicB family nuclease
VFEPEPDGSAWNVSIPAIQGCVTYGRSLAEARRNIREALSLFEEEFKGKADEVAAAAVFDEDIRLPTHVRGAVQQFAKVREQETELQARKVRLARIITQAYSLRDAGELLHMSPEGVRKLIRAGELAREEAPQTAKTRPRVRSKAEAV